MIKTHSLCRLLFLLLGLTLLSLTAFAVQGEVATSGSCGNSANWVYDPDSHTLTISGTGPMTDYVSSIWSGSGYTIETIIIEDGITHIGARAFKNLGDLTELSLPRSLTSIGDSSLNHCFALESVILPDGLEQIGSYAFAECSSLKAVTIPGTVDTIGEMAFQECVRLESLTMGTGIKTIDFGAFYCCSSLRTLVIPESVERIENYAFSDCRSLTNVVIPHTVNYIGRAAFFGLSKVEEVCFGGSLTKWEYLLQQVNTGFTETTAVELNSPLAHSMKDGICEICGWKQVVGGTCGRDLTWELDLSEGVLRITGTGYMYYVSDVPVWNQYKSAIVKVELPEGMLSITEWAFENCTYLESISIPQSVVSIAQGAFWACDSLKAITLWNGKCRIHEEAWALSDPEVLTIYSQPNSPVQTFVEELGYIFRPVCLCEEGRGDYEITSTQATCTKGGYTVYRCKVCDYSCRTNETEALGHTYTYTALGDSHTALCFCGETFTAPHSYENHVCQCGKTSGITIRHTLNLASDIHISFTVKEEEIATFDTSYMVCVLPVYEGNVQTGTRSVRVASELKNGYYYFTLKDLAAIHMNDTVEATLHMVKDEKTYTCPPDQYSIVTYAMSQLNKTNAGDELKALCANLLRYGATAQIYKGYRTDALADQSLTDTHRSYFTDLETIDFGPKYTWYEDPQNDVKWVGKSLDLQSRVAAKFIVDVSEYRQPISALVLYVSYENSKGETVITALRNPEVYDSSKNYYAFTFDGLNAADLRTELTLTMCMYEDMVVAVDVLYSMASYGNGKTGTLLTLCQALLAYSDCAKAYFD